MTKMSASKNVVEFKLIPIEKLPPRTYRKGSKYAPIMDAFIEATKDKPYMPINVNVEDAKPNYLRTQLKKLIDRTEAYEDINVCVVNGQVFLERAESKEL